MTVKIALYARVSRPEQILDNQILVLQSEVAKHEDWVVVDTYTDKASGANQSRPGLDRMMADARKGRFTLIVATKLDRIARSITNMMKLFEELDKLGVGIKFAEQPEIDTTTAMGRLIRVILGAIAEFELELIHERTKDGIARARKEGKIVGRPKSTLSEYQLNKAREILANDPNISQRKLAEQFNGIGRRQLIEGLIEHGIWKR